MNDWQAPKFLHRAIPTCAGANVSVVQPHVSAGALQILSHTKSKLPIKPAVAKKHCDWLLDRRDSTVGV